MFSFQAHKKFLVKCTFPLCVETHRELLLLRWLSPEQTDDFMKIIKVSYGPTEGVSISGLYLRETTTTQKSGTLLGGGLSQSGVVLGGGGYSGSETNQTVRSVIFAPPQGKTAEPDLSRMHELLMYLVVGFIALNIFTYGAYGIFMLTGFELSKTAVDLFESSFYFYMTIGIVAALCIMLMAPRDYSPVLMENRKNELRKEVYLRLRYVDSDNLVFDPVTLMGCHADRDYISSLIENIIR